jgi:DNA end-binding protein Ku
MATRPAWQGHLRLSLVTCPVALYTAIARTGDVHFNMLHNTTHNRIRMVPTDPETGPVDRADIVKGYEIEKGRYVVVTQEEIEGVRLETTRTIDIDRFVAEEEIDRLYWDEPYFLVPDGKLAVEAYAVIREAMRAAGRIALGRVVMHAHERMVAIEPRGEGLLAYTLRTHDEVRDAKAAFADIPDAKPDPRMIDIAAKIIEQQEGPFEPSEFKDRYEDALRDLIRRKEKGAGRTVTAEEPQRGEVIDLMEALRKSLGANARRGAVKPPARADRSPQTKAERPHRSRARRS